ncbi:MAG: NTP transferase domain-containing protein, partial [Chloroflexota bacterium]|nr:NTP transferase domain-containing protein [Chloroflexota bacterium]
MANDAGGQGGTIAVVPVKALTDAKSRLAPILTADERRALTLRMLHGVLAALDLPEIAARLVVSPSPQVLRAAQAAGTATLEQTGHGLNNALVEGREWAAGGGAGAILVVLGDLPLLTAADVAAMLDLAADGVP